MNIGKEMLQYIQEIQDDKFICTEDCQFQHFLNWKWIITKLEGREV